MTLSSAILALSPWLYWKMDDSVGSTTLADSSGNSRNGSLTGTVTFGQSGPEWSTTSARYFSDGIVTGPQPFSGAWSAFTLMFMWTTPADGTIPSLTDVLGIGDTSNRHAHGLYLQQLSSTNGSAQLQLRGSTTSVGTSAATFPQSNWHLSTFTYTTTPLWTPYMDSSAGTTAASNAGSVPLSTDHLWIQATNRIVLAHLAIFTSQLTTAQVATVGSQVVAWPYPNPINVVTYPASVPDLTPITTQLTAIQSTQTSQGTTITDTDTKVTSTQTSVNTIESQVSGMVTTTFPSLNTLINNVYSAVQSTVETAAGSVTKTVGELLGGKALDLLTTTSWGPTCHPSVITQTLSGGDFFGVQAICDSHEASYVFTGPDDYYCIQSMGTLEISRGGALVYTCGLHTLSHTVYPLPGFPSEFVLSAIVGVPPDYDVRLVPAPGTCWTLVGLELP